MATQRKRFSIRDEGGQSLVILILAMTAILAMAALAIDVSQWYATRHQAQVTADSMALAAANDMANDATAASAQTLGQSSTYTNGSGLQPSAATVSIDTTKDQVTATVSAPGSRGFTPVFGIGSETITATAVASYQAQVNYSMIADNSGCAAGDGISMAGNGGGNMDITGIADNGLFTDNNNSGSSQLVGVYNQTCSSSDTFDKNANPDVSSETGTISFPINYSAPGTANGPACTSTASSFADSAISSGTASSPHIYCATGTCTGLTQGKNKFPSGAGTIDLSHTVTNVELYADCIELDSGANGSTSPANEPLVYGAGSGTNSTVFFAGNNITLTGTVYVPNSTVEFTFNNDIITFVEASNIVIDKNNAGSPSISGNGPIEIVPTDTLTQ